MTCHMKSGVGFSHLWHYVGTKNVLGFGAFGVHSFRLWMFSLFENLLGKHLQFLILCCNLNGCNQLWISYLNQPIDSILIFSYYLDLDPYLLLGLGNCLLN